MQIKNTDYHNLNTFTHQKQLTIYLYNKVNKKKKKKKAWLKSTWNNRYIKGISIP